VAAAGLIAERGGALVTAFDGGPWFDISRPQRSLGVLAAPAAHHAALLELVRDQSPRPRTVTPRSRKREHVASDR
jgi:hypothetical protein